ncbi:2-phosphosulfolactate phosphatase [Virgibacillus doumboii]|uniref:2-phosphosulfolactate phosphatase n=1 Tax=Virgibacillus doumboii TaxID=2697503 RepID=UPI0013E0BADF|nr:2-phosphosulfolactate phosphatase [Virgibacillus doumboii]
MQINIYQGRSAPLEDAHITIVVDVIRAFTVAHYALQKGVTHISLVETTEDAFRIKTENPAYLLAGETNGLAIEGFDLDNSPYNILQQNLSGRALVQKTTNGVQAALNCLSSNDVLVTGFTNARTTAEYVRRLMAKEKQPVVNIVASHPSGDDDLACAAYIKSILEDSNSIPVGEVMERIKNSHVARKFFDEDNPAFKREDVLACIEEMTTDFVMKMNGTGKTPMIVRVNV